MSRTASWSLDSRRRARKVARLAVPATSSASLWYADHPTVPFGIDARQIGASPLNLAVGATLRLDGGFLFSADYRSIIDRTAVQHLLRVGLSTKL